jgi:hypothetical protein
MDRRTVILIVLYRHLGWAEEEEVEEEGGRNGEIGFDEFWVESPERQWKGRLSF